MVTGDQEGGRSRHQWLATKEEAARNTTGWRPKTGPVKKRTAGDYFFRVHHTYSSVSTVSK